MFHMGWFMKQGLGVQGWGAPWSGQIGQDWMLPDLYIDMAKALERACFDYMMIEDSSNVNDIYQGNMDYVLRKAASTPKNDPMPMVAILGHLTKRIGIVGTMSTSFYHPFMAARLGATLDHVTRGRAGLNLVTSSSHRAAQNYGLDQHYEHDERYRIAAEWAELTFKLWESWAPGAVVADEATGVYADAAKVHRVDFAGDYFKSRGPLNTIPGPQGRPVICQAGGSSAGRAFGAQYADTIIGSARGVAGMKAYRQDITDLMTGFGRDPKACKVLFLVSPVIAEDDASAKAKRDRIKAAEARNIEAKLASLSYFTGVDMSQFDLDQPLPEFDHNGHRSTVADFRKAGTTLRQMATHAATESVEIVGSPDSVAAQMGEIMQEVGGDGFLIGNTITRRSIAEIADGLGPALKRRKLTRSGYAHAHFRDNLLDF
jgi:FMN-dependent oxidoreductase (nitrilotriacetate monooxygenase family)